MRASSIQHTGYRAWNYTIPNHLGNGKTQMNIHIQNNDEYLDPLMKRNAQMFKCWRYFKTKSTISFHSNAFDDHETYRWWGWMFSSIIFEYVQKQSKSNQIYEMINNFLKCFIFHSAKPNLAERSGSERFEYFIRRKMLFVILYSLFGFIWLTNPWWKAFFFLMYFVQHWQTSPNRTNTQHFSSEATEGTQYTTQWMMELKMLFEYTKCSLLDAFFLNFHFPLIRIYVFRLL